MNFHSLWPIGKQEQENDFPSSIVDNNNYYMPSTFYIVKLPLALGNIFNWTESIMAQSHDGAKNPYWGLIMDFWHCLIVMTYRNRALFRLELD